MVEPRKVNKFKFNPIHFLCQAIECAVVNPFTYFMKFYATQGTVSKQFNFFVRFYATYF